MRGFRGSPLSTNESKPNLFIYRFLLTLAEAYNFNAKPSIHAFLPGYSILKYGIYFKIYVIPEEMRVLTLSQVYFEWFVH